MPELRSYQDLDVWQRSIKLVVDVYRLSAGFPVEEKFGLTKQLRRSAVSVPANIAEGAGRNGTKEFVHFLGVASGSLAETDTHLVVSQELGLVQEDDVRCIRDAVVEVGRMLAGLRRSLRNNPPRRQ